VQPVCRHLARTYWGRGCPLETCRLDLFCSLRPSSINSLLPPPTKKKKKETHATSRSSVSVSARLARRGATLSCPSCLSTSRPDRPSPRHSVCSCVLPIACSISVAASVFLSLSFSLQSPLVLCLHGNTPPKTCDRTTTSLVGSLTAALLPRDLHPCVQTCTPMMSIMLNMTTGPDTTPVTTTAAPDPPGTGPLTGSPTALRSTAMVTADEPRPSRGPTHPPSSLTGIASASP
jgi:hypothetical protein